jgi:predicted MPP superfamily phosphohydrolase
MRIFFPLIFATVVILVFGSFELLLLRFLNRTWWRNKYIRTAAWALPLFGVAMVLAWGLGEYYTLNWLSLPASVMAALTFIFEVGLMLSLPVSGFFHFIHWSIERYVTRRKTRQPALPDPNRRILLKAAAAGLPVLTLATGVSGLTNAFGDIRVYKKPIIFDSLPPSLEGLKILHLSDIHLRHYVTLDDLSEVISQAEQFAPHLVLVTGDIADDLRLLPDTLALIFSLRPSLGIFASLGNHEYYRGVSAVRQIFDRSPIPLLVNNGVHISVGSSSLFVGGIDDPRFLGVRDTAFFQRTIDQTITDATSEDFVVLMSHRPNAFDYAAESAIDLTLAGHTHGGQIGVMHRSLFETVWPEGYFWGHYRLKKSHLYTSSGVGHWFPFRLGCPPEAPVIELCRL